MNYKLIKQSSFILSVIVIVLVLLSIPFRAQYYEVAGGVLVVAMVLMVIDWILTLKDILQSVALTRQSRWFWVAAITLLLPVGCLLYIWNKLKSSQN